MKTSWLLVPLLLAFRASAATNLVDPLSNGLQLSMTGPQIKEKFGAPPYAGWSVETSGRREEIKRVTLSKDVRLASGIGPGSSRADVQRAFGAADRAEVGAYSLTFSYAGDRVSEVRIESAGRRAKKRAGTAGTWRGTGGTVGLLELKPDGTYTSPDGGKGRWKTAPDGVVFTGALKAWNGGRAKFTDEKHETLEFSWQDEKGRKRYFAFSKG